MKIKPLPGARLEPTNTSTTSPKQNYVITLKEEKDASQKTRSQIYNEGIVLTGKIQEEIRKYLAKNGIKENEYTMGEPSPFPIITITCIKRVKELIEKLPDVDFIAEDSDDAIGFIP